MHVHKQMPPTTLWRMRQVPLPTKGRTADRTADRTASAEQRNEHRDEHSPFGPPAAPTPQTLCSSLRQPDPAPAAATHIAHHTLRVSTACAAKLTPQQRCVTALGTVCCKARLVGRRGLVAQATPTSAHVRRNIALHGARGRSQHTAAARRAQHQHSSETSPQSPGRPRCP